MMNEDNIENRVKGCKHDVLVFMGHQEHPLGYKIPLGDCMDCHSTRSITAKYYHAGCGNYVRKARFQDKK